MRKDCFIIMLLISLLMTACRSGRDKDGYMSVEEAMKALAVPAAAAEYVPVMQSQDEFPRAFQPPYRPVEPVKLFDNLYFAGTNAVGSFIIDSGEGLIMMDTGCGEEDASMIADGFKKLGLDLSHVKLIFISHEHFDHYGGVTYLKKNFCPDAKVAMSLTGWNMLQTVPSEWAYVGTRPESIDIFLTDGMKIKYGDARIQIVATPGHSPGCLSFIFRVTDNGEEHMAGIMGGMGVWPTQVETRLYKSSLEYFKAVSEAAGCDVGLFFHSLDRHFAAIRDRKPDEPNPLVIGREDFDKVYLQQYRNRCMQVLNSDNMVPYPVI